MYSDNCEFYTRDDELLFKNEFGYQREAMLEGKAKTGLIGRITGSELMNKVRYALPRDQRIKALTWG